MSTRYTIEHLKSGQDRPYGPSIYVTRFSVEMLRHWEKDAEWEPWDLTEDSVRKLLLGMPQSGFTDFVRPTGRALTEGEYFTMYLVSLVKEAPGVWLFECRSEYTG